MPPVNPNPKILETKNKNEAELKRYLKTFFESLQKSTTGYLAVSAEELTRITAKYKGTGTGAFSSPSIYAAYINLYGEDFFDMVYFGNQPGIGLIGEGYYINNLLRVKSAEISLSNNKALISVPEDKIVTDKSIVSKHFEEKQEDRPYIFNDLSGPNETRLRHKKVCSLHRRQSIPCS